MAFIGTGTYTVGAPAVAAPVVTGAVAAPVVTGGLIGTGTYRAPTVVSSVAAAPAVVSSPVTYASPTVVSAAPTYTTAPRVVSAAPTTYVSTPGIIGTGTIL